STRYPPKTALNTITIPTRASIDPREATRDGLLFRIVPPPEIVSAIVNVELRIRLSADRPPREPFHHFAAKPAAHPHGGAVNFFLMRPQADGAFPGTDRTDGAGHLSVRSEGDGGVRNGGRITHGSLSSRTGGIYRAADADRK